MPPTDPSPKPHALRPLGGLERLFWNLDRNIPVHFVVAAEIAGGTTPQAWEEALRAAQRRHPLLSCFIAVGEDGLPRWYPGSAPIPLRVVDGRSLPHWEREIEQEISRSFAWDQAPLARATLVHAEDRCAFLLAVHHSIADGMSLAYVIRDLLRSLSGEGLEAGELPPSQEELQRWPVSAATSSVPSAEMDAPEPVVYRVSGRGRPAVGRLRLDASLTRKLQARARHEGTTVHAALNAAIALAIPPRGGRACRVFSPINVRKLIGLGEECVMAVCAGTTAVEPGPTSSFWDIARQAGRELQGARTPESLRAMEDAIGEFFSRDPDVREVAEFGARIFAYEVVLTNLGKDAIGTDFGPLRLEALWGPAVLLGYEGEQTIGAATLNDRLCLMHTSYSPIPSLLETIVQTLATACE